LISAQSETRRAAEHDILAEDSVGEVCIAAPGISTRIFVRERTWSGE